VPGTKTTRAIERLDASLDRFMRYFLVHINPILHRTEYRGRSYSEYEIIVVMALGHVGPTRPIGLSRGLRIEKGTLTSLIRRLRELGLVTKRTIPGDERSYLVALTAAGRTFKQHLDRQRHREMAALFAAMDPEQIAAAAHGFDLMSAYLGNVEETLVRLGEETAAGT
jgi:DNA-binding MarR family transcriptional regulator